MKCEWCEGPFSTVKSWQRFCQPKCRDAWNNREKLRRQIEAAEERHEQRVNGHAIGARGPKIGLAELGLLAKPEPVKRRHL